MNYFRLLVTSILISMLLSACSSRLKTANKHLENKEYQSAITVYQEVLRRDKGNSEAMAGLRKAQMGYISKKLLTVRKHRLAGDQQSALELLSELISLENETKIFPTNTEFSTQKEELRYGYIYLSKKINLHLKKKHPLAAKKLYDTYAHVYEQGDTLNKTKILKSYITKVGLKSCKKLLKYRSSSKPYYTSFSSQYCSYWGYQKAQKNIASIKRKINKQLYSRIKFINKKSNLPAEALGKYKQSLQESFQASPWYSAGGVKTLTVYVSARFKNNYSENSTFLNHEYTVNIPYTAYRTVTKSIDVPYNTTESRYDYVAKRYVDKMVTKKRTEYYEEKEPYTAYRVDPRSQPYMATAYTKNYMLLLDLTSSVDRSIYHLNIHKQNSYSGVYHNNHMPKIGLYPKSVDFVEPLNWLESVTKSMYFDSKIQFNKIWYKKFCDIKIEKLSFARQGDLVGKCIRGIRLSEVIEPKFVSKWFINHFGLSYADVSEMVETI